MAGPLSITTVIGCSSPVSASTQPTMRVRPSRAGGAGPRVTATGWPAVRARAVHVQRRGQGCLGARLERARPVGAHNWVVGADQRFRAPSWDQESVRDSVHEDSASAHIAAGQLPRPSFRHPQGPVSGDAASVPAQQRVGGDQPPGSARPRERGRNRSEQAAVGVGELGSVDLSAQHSELVAQDDDLDVLGAA